MEALWVKVKASGTRMRKQWTSIARAAAASVLLDLIHRHPDEVCHWILPPIGVIVTHSHLT